MVPHRSNAHSSRRALGRAALALRIGVALQCAALAWLALKHGTSLDAALFMELETSERTAVLADRALAATALAATGLLVLRSRGRGVVVAALFAAAAFLVVALATRAAGGRAFAELAPAAHATRWFAPVALTLLAFSRSRPGSRPRAARAGLVLRLAVAATFCAHGWQALGHDPAFVDLLLGSARRWTGGAPSEAAAETLLTVIGAVDVAIALALLSPRWRPAAAWATVWGLVTLTSRVVALGTEFLHESLLRSMNGLAPLALWWLAAALAAPEPEAHESP